MIELTIEQVKKHPASFLYVFADEQGFLQKINKKYATIIRGKKANQMKVLALSAEKYGKTYSEYADAVKTGFEEIYGMRPTQALVTLAEGGEVAGKNWSEGVFGVGSLSNKFKGTDITVDPKTGYMQRNGKLLPAYDTNYTDVNGKSVAYQIFYYDEASGNTYMSQYNKTLKKYYAQSYSNTEGQSFAALSGLAIGASDGASLWGNITLGVNWFSNILKWILSIFGINLPSIDSSVTTINEDNTLPDQKADGFVYESGFGEAGGIVLALVLGGTLLAGGFKNTKKKK